MAVPQTNIRFSRIETEVNEGIQAHPDIHDELIRYSWSRYVDDDPLGGSYYEGLSHHSLCKTAILYKGFMSNIIAFLHSTHGGYSIKEFRGYDWENHGVELSVDSTDHFNDDLGGFQTSVDEHTLIINLSTTNAFHVKSRGNNYGIISPIRAHTAIQTDYSHVGSRIHITVTNEREFSNETHSGNGFTSTPTNRFVIDLDNSHYITSVKARWRLYKYFASCSDNYGAIVAMIEKDDSNPASYEYANIDTVAQNGLREGNQTEYAGTFYDITPKGLGYSDEDGTSDFAGQEFGTGTRCVSALGCYQSGTDGNYDTTTLKLNSGGYYEYSIRFYHEAATRDFTVLNIRAAYTGTSESGRRTIEAKALYAS